ITTHLGTNAAVAPNQVCPGIRIHIIERAQPPGMRISPIADMDTQQAIVIATLAAKTIAETPRNARRESTTRLAWFVPVVGLPPPARLVATLRWAVEPLIHAPQAVQAARIGRVGVVHDAVLQRERAHARTLARVRGRVGSCLPRDLGDGIVA